MRVTVQKAAPQDLDAIAALYGAVCDYLADKPFNPGWRRDIFPAREDAAQYLAADALYIALDGGRIAGSIALTPEAEGVLFIHELAVHPNFHRRGVGSALLDFAVKEGIHRGADVLRLHVWEGNGPAIQTYEKNSFVRVGKEDIGLGELGLHWFYLYEKRLDR